MLAAGTGTEVLACHEDLSAVGRVVQHKVGVGSAVGTVTPVAEEVVAEPFARRGFEETCGDNLVGIDILQRKGHARAGDDIEFLFHCCILLNDRLGTWAKAVRAGR